MKRVQQSCALLVYIILKDYIQFKPGSFKLSWATVVFWGEAVSVVLVVVSSELYIYTYTLKPLLISTNRNK